MFLGPLHNISVRTVACSHGVVGAASPVQLKAWTKPILVRIGTTRENLLIIILKNTFLLENSFLKIVSYLKFNLILTM